MLDLKAGTMEIPGGFSKNRRGHRVYRRRRRDVAALAAHA
jgi:hypothetical protein